MEAKEVSTDSLHRAFERRVMIWMAHANLNMPEVTSIYFEGLRDSNRNKHAMGRLIEKLIGNNLL